MRRVLIGLALLAAIGAARAQTHVELGAGVSWGTPQNDGIWYQTPLPHHLNLTSNAIEIGTRTELTRYLALDTRAYWLGHNASYAWAVADAAYRPHSLTGCEGACPGGSHFIGHGSNGGLSAMLELHTGGAWQFGVAFGPVYMRETWTMHIPDWFLSSPDGMTQIGPARDAWIRADRWAWRYTTALRLTHGSWYASLTRYPDGPNLDPKGYFPPVWKSHTVLIIGHSF